MISPSIPCPYFSTTVARYSFLLPVMYTRAPFAANAFVIMRPMPEPPPVTTALEKKTRRRVSFSCDLSFWGVERWSRERAPNPERLLTSWAPNERYMRWWGCFGCRKWRNRGKTVETHTRPLTENSLDARRWDDREAIVWARKVKRREERERETLIEHSKKTDVNKPSKRLLTI